MSSVSVSIMRPLRTLASISLMSLAALVSCRSTVKTTSDPICREYETKYPNKSTLVLNNQEVSNRLLTRNELIGDFTALSRSLYNTDKYAICLSIENGGALSPYDIGNGLSVTHCKKIDSKLCAPVINTRKAITAAVASVSSAPVVPVVPTAAASVASSGSTPTASVSASSGGKASKVFISISPASGPVGTVGAITVTVRGQIEEEGEPSVFISGPSGITTSNVTVVNRNTIRVDINLVDATLGRNTVSVSIGEKLLGTSSFTVVAQKASKADTGESGEDVE